ncbi:diacylglycerol kinase family protein [Thiobacillus denitrificans]|uniref:Uncharacterized protein n=1 Tax=Thiobacillus denitrificans TaxID=36861 RepID=A0A106BM55_THIDE|nr:diacylglycerol kinase family protein [Thiobacillus denitrificans]KVW94962.1 hypothetical protein ABW22_10975 [Thiobacillus denitrificans]
MRLKSFAHALRGVDHLVRTQPNARLHLLAAVLVCAAGVYVGLGRAARRRPPFPARQRRHPAGRAR